MKQRKPQEPYEVMPDGEQHATSDYVAKIIAALMIAVIFGVLYSCPAHAEEKNWCAAFKDGYEASFYLTCRSCQEIEPVKCPKPKPTDTSGYMRGVVDGSADGKAKQKEYLP